MGLGRLTSKPRPLDLEKVRSQPPQGGRPEILRVKWDLMDRGYHDHDTEHEIPVGGTPELQDVRFENGGVRKDFGLDTISTPAPGRIRDHAEYAAIDPFTFARINSMVRISDQGGTAALQLLSPSDVWGPVILSTEPIEDTLVHASTIQGFLVWADGERIHMYSESSPGLTDIEDDFVNSTGTGPDGEMIAVGEIHELNLSETPADQFFTVRWRVETLSGLGILIIGFEYFDGAAWVSYFKKQYVVNGAQVWADEFADIENVQAAASTQHRLTVLKAYGAFEPLIPTTPEFKVTGEGVLSTSERAGISYIFLPPVSVQFELLSEDAPKAAYVFPFEDRVIALGGNDNPQRVAGSADGDVREWRVEDEDLAPTGAFDYPILDTVTDPIDDMMAGGKVANNTAAILRKRSILRMEETGGLSPPVAVFDWIDGIGTESPYSVAQVPDGIIFLGHDHTVYYFTGEQAPQPIGKPIHQRLVETVYDEDLPYVIGQYDQKLGEYWMAIPENGSGDTQVAWWIFRLEQFRSTGELVWRYRRFIGSTTCEPAAVALPTPPTEPPPPGNGGEPSEPIIPPQTVTEVVLEGVPFEIIESTTNGLVWIGYVGGEVGFDDVIYDVFDPPTGDRVYRVRVSEMNVPAGFGPPHWANGTGAAYHPIRDEVWLYVGADPDPPGGTDGVAAISVRDAQTFVEKAFHVYPSIETVSAVGGSRAIEYCPVTQNIYFAGREDDAATPGNPWIAFEVIPATGAIDKRWKYSNDVSFGGSLREDIPSSFGWNADKARFVGTTGVFDQPFAFDPTDGGGLTEDFTGGAVLGSLGETTFEYGEIEEWPGQSGLMFHVTTRTADQIDHGISVPAAIGPLPNWSPFAEFLTSSFGGGFGAFAVEHSPFGLLASVANTDLWDWTDPDPDAGAVILYDVHGNVLHTWRLDQVTARLVWIPLYRAFGVVDDYWEFRTDRIVRFRQFTDLQLEPGPSPEQPQDPTSPAPGPEPEPDPGPAPSDAPEITGSRKYCDVAGDPGVAGVEIDYTDDPTHVGVAVQIRCFAPDADPDRATPLYEGATVVDADTVRLQTQSVPAASNPICTTKERNDADQFLDVYLRHDLGSGTFSAYSNKARVRVHSLLPLPADAQPPGGTVNAPVWKRAVTRCILTEEADTGQKYALSYVDLVAERGTVFFENLPYEFAEFTQGDDPNVDPPLRTKIDSSRIEFDGQESFVVFRVEYDDGWASPPSCSVPAGTLTRDYYVRHIKDDGTFGPWSTLQRLTLSDPGGTP